MNQEYQKNQYTNTNENLSKNLKYNINGLPLRYENVDFSNYYPFCIESKKKKEVCLRIAQKKKGKISSVLCGNVGTGKTHLAISIIKNLPKIEFYVDCMFKNGKYVQINKENCPFQEIYKKSEWRKINCKYLKASNFFSELNDSRIKGKSKLDLINNYVMNFDIILFDDLSDINYTISKQENFYILIEQIYNNLKNIIITTNLTMEELEKIDKRVTSRLAEICNILKFTHDDYRMRKRE